MRMENYYTVIQVRELIGVTRQRVWSLVKRGTLAAVNVDGLVLVERGELHRYIGARVDAAKAEAERWEAIRWRLGE